MNRRLIMTDKDEAAVLAGSFKYTPVLGALALSIVVERRPFAARHGSKATLWAEVAGAINDKCKASRSKLLYMCTERVNSHDGCSGE